MPPFHSPGIFGLCWIAVMATASGDNPIFYFPEAAKSRPQAIVPVADGTLWYATLTTVNHIRVDGSKIAEIKLPDTLTTTVGGTVVQSLAFGSDGNLWGAYNQGNAIWRMTP